MKPFFLSRFPSSVMLFGRKLPKLAENGDSNRILHILEKGAFGVEKYNESYLSFAECQHRKEGLEILIAAHEKFPTDNVSILGTNQSALRSANRSSCSFSHIFSLKHSLSINFRLAVKMYRATKYNGQKNTERKKGTDYGHSGMHHFIFVFFSKKTLKTLTSQVQDYVIEN